MTMLRICALDDLAPDSAKLFKIEGLKLSVVRIEDDVFVIGDTCSHADFSLSEGDIDVDAKTLECDKHGAAFSLTNGEPQCLPATKPVPVFEVEVREGEVYVLLPGSEPEVPDNPGVCDANSRNGVPS